MTSQLACAALHQDILHVISSCVDMAHRKRATRNERSLTPVNGKRIACCLAIVTSYC